jgi:hypothetical protein
LDLCQSKNLLSDADRRLDPAEQFFDPFVAPLADVAPDMTQGKDFETLGRG